MGILVGKWDCPYCDTIGISGDIRECPHCGRPRNENTRFYLGDNPTRLTEKQAETLNKNPDWVCPYCNALNSDNDTICKSCGSPKTNRTYYQQNPDRNKILSAEEAHSSTHSTEYASSSAYRNYNNYEDNAPNNTDKEPTPIHTSNKIDTPLQTSHRASFHRNYGIGDWFSDNWRKILIVLACIATVAGLIYLIIPKIQTGTVTGMRWEYTINYEKYRNVTEEGWSIPVGGTEVSHRREIRSYNTVLDYYETKTRTYTVQVHDHDESYVSGYRDLGNGHFEEIYSTRPVYRTETRTETYQEPVYRQDPVWDTKYTYTIWKWVDAPEYRQITKGTTKETRWAVVRSIDGVRESSRHANYYITVVTPKNKTHEYSVNEATWTVLAEDMTIRYKVILGGLQLVNE